jgi:DNA polymerase III alpha subunit
MAAWKRKGGVQKFHERIVGGMVERGYTAEFAQGIFRQIEGFGEYGFPESHAASFALLVWVSCWLKRHEPAAFLAAMLNSQPLGFYTPSQLVQDARRHDIEVRPIDVTTSDWDCTLEENEAALGNWAGPREIGVGSRFGRSVKEIGGRIPIRSTSLEITSALHPNRALTPISHPQSHPKPHNPPSASACAW